MSRPVTYSCKVICTLVCVAKVISTPVCVLYITYYSSVVIVATSQAYEALYVTTKSQGPGDPKDI